MIAALPTNEVQRLATLQGYDVLDTPPEVAFDKLTTLASQICHTPIALVSLVDESRQWFKSALGLSATETSRDYAFCAHAILVPQDLLEVSDTLLDPRFADNPLVTGAPYIRFYAGSPLIAPDGLPLGTLCVIDRVPRVLNSEQRIALRALGDTVITQLELRRSLVVSGSYQKKLQSLNESLEIRVEERTHELQIAAAAFEARIGIVVTDINSKIIKINQAYIEQTGYCSEELIGFSPRILKSGRHDTYFYEEMWNCISKNGAWQGEIWDRKKSGESFPTLLNISAIKDKLGVVKHYVGTQTDISEQKAAESAIANLAYYDSLTQLPNRRLLHDRLKKALATSDRNSHSGALLFIDLDNFKEINDTLGHGWGDLLLQQVAQRLASRVREGDTVSRIGGDEFMVMLEFLSHETIEAAAQSKEIAGKILDALNQPFYLGNHEYICTPSIGITLFNDQKEEIEVLFQQADIAMYQAKKAGRNMLKFFDPEMQERISLRSNLERELRNAIANNELKLYYQIQVDAYGRAIGAEALIRWISPGRGLVNPAEFIPIAEENGIIVQIGQWVFEEACSQIRLWELEVATRDLELSVNVSAIQLKQADFVEKVISVVNRFGIDPRRLNLELTESMLQDNIEDAIVKIQALKSCGIKFSLDDFGTGYSSLQYLRKLPINQLKIDQSFIRDLDNAEDKAIVRTIIAMAKSLQLEVIAEGVEKESQRGLLFNKGCNKYQGYLFGKPVPIEQFDALILALSRNKTHFTYGD
jgi:diguanylate cyclase (GGDEF)-like protein/PAS domain S-box-containing protein